MVNNSGAGEFMGAHYHSQYDNENFYQEPIYRSHYEMYVGLVLASDRIAAMPMNFARLLRGAATGIDGSMCRGADAGLLGLHLVLKQEIQAGEALYSKIREINRTYSRLLDRGEEEKAFLLAVGCKSLNRELLRIFEKEQDYFARPSWHGDVFFLQQAVQENVRVMDRIIAYLGNRSLPGALEAVYTIDNNRYIFLFEEKIYTYFMEYVPKQPPSRLK